MKSILQKSFLLFGTIALLSGCFGSSTEEEQRTIEEEASAGTTSYTLALPANWDPIPENNYPENIIYAAKEQTSNTLEPSFIAVAKETDIQTTDIKLFTQRNIENIRKASQDFQLVAEESFANDKTSLELIEYTDKNTRTNEIMGFFSLFALPNENNGGYALTISHDLDITPQKKEELKNILLSFDTK